MKTPEQILKEAKAAKAKDSLASHKETILTLRQKKYSWREIAKFLGDRGVETDHTKVFRFIQKPGSSKMDPRPKFVVPTADSYVDALKAIESKMSPMQRKMIEFHYRAHNRTATYTELAKDAGYDSHLVANANYGKLGKVLGDRLGISYVPLHEDDPETPFYSSAIGTAKKYGDEEWQLIMHHELAKAIDKLGWFASSEK